MFKVIGIIKRPHGMDFDAFKTWWLTEHAPKVKKWPGLVKYHINLSTTPDQIAIAPGSLKREWTENGRRYFEYVVDHPSMNFYSFMSADYAVHREK